MKNKNKITFGVIGGLILALGSGYFLVSNSDKDDTPVTAIYLDSNNQPYSDEVEDPKKTTPNSVGHIKGNFNNEDREVTENFTLNKLTFHNVNLEIPDYFQTFSNVEADDILSLKTKKSDIGNPYVNNSFSISIMDNTSNSTPESYSQNLEAIAELNKDPDYSSNMVRELKKLSVEGNIVKVKYAGNYESLKDSPEFKKWNSSTPTKFTVYNYVVFQDNKIYNIEYVYEDETIGNKVIDILNNSITIKPL